MRKSTIEHVVRRVESRALVQLQDEKDSSSEAKDERAALMEEYNNIVQSRKLLLSVREPRGRKMRGRRREPTQTVRLMYRPLGTAEFPSILAVASAVKDQFSKGNLVWSAPKKTLARPITRRRVRNLGAAGENLATEVPNLPAVKPQDVGWHFVKNPTHLKWLRKLTRRVMTKERPR